MPNSPARPKTKAAKKSYKGKTPNPPIKAKPEDSGSEAPKLVYAKKSAPIPILPVIPEFVVDNSAPGILSVVPILQTVCDNNDPSPSLELEEFEEQVESDATSEVGQGKKSSKASSPPDSPKERKSGRRRKKLTVEQKQKLKQAANKEMRKRNFERVLLTRTQQFMGIAQSTTFATIDAAVDKDSSCASSVNEDSQPSTSRESSVPAPGPQPVLPEFNWTKYLADNVSNARAAPSRLFRQPAFPPNNPFR
jgi:hypothetical protein